MKWAVKAMENSSGMGKLWPSQTSSASGPLSQAVSEGCNKNGGGNRADNFTEEGAYL